MEDINPINVLAETSLGYAASAEELAAGGDGGVPAAAAPAALAPFARARRRRRRGAGGVAEVEVPRAEWDELGLDTAPFTVQHCAPMSLVHFYFRSSLAAFVVERGRFVMINSRTCTTPTSCEQKNTSAYVSVQATSLNPCCHLAYYAYGLLLRSAAVVPAVVLSVRLIVGFGVV